MDEREFRTPEEEMPRQAADETEEQGRSCDNIDDPFRRGLCKLCGLPVVGEAPFCKNHEYPAP